MKELDKDNKKKWEVEQQIGLNARFVTKR
jgi:hypothetical protein